MNPIDALNSVAAELTRGNPDRQYYWNLQGWRTKETLRLLTEHAPKSTHAKILDVGCNPPFLLSTLAELGYKASGFDLWPDRFQDAVERYRLDVRQGNAETDPLPYRSESFDVVDFTEVFEHLRINPIKTICELRRVLRPGGVLLLSTPNLYSLNGIYSLLRHGRANACATDSLYQQFDAVNRIGIFGHIREYTWCEVSQFLMECGFAPVTPYFLGGATKFWPLRAFYRLIPSLKPAVQFIAVKNDTAAAVTSVA